jgi:cyclic pyranopterin phosphate synthase
MSKSPFSHLDASGEASMVDVGEKPIVRREAVATGILHCAPPTIAALRSQALPKGDVLAVARIAAIQAAKRTDELIPLCHSLPLDRVGVDFEVGEDHITITATVSTSAKTGVEMEALTAVAVAGLTLYDMLKAVDKAMVLGEIQVVKKTKQ